MSTKRVQIKKYKQLAKQLQAVAKGAERAAGALEALLKQMKEEHGCNTIEEAIAKLKKLQDKRGELAQRFNDMLETFENEYGDLLKGAEEEDS